MIICVSASHTNASLSMLESLNFKDKNEFMRTVCSENKASECVVIQTCHRVEIFYVLQDAKRESLVNQLLKLWSTRTGVSLDIISKTLSIYQGREAIGHLFSLASGLESMVIGEDQILGQIRASYYEARKNGTVGLVLAKVFMKAINIGRRVRTETKINEGSVSISSAAVDLATKELGDLASTKALVIGAGEAGSIAAETLRRHGATTIIIANRTYKKGFELAKRVSGKAIALNRIQAVLPAIDLVIGAVSVAQPILKEKQFASVITNNTSSKKILVIDISQPRAFDERIGSLNGVCLKTINDLKEIVDETMRDRQKEAEKARIIISEELARFEIVLSQLFVQPLISEICRKFEDIRKKEFDRAVRKLGESDGKKLLVLERFSRELIERIAQIPIEQLRKAALNSNGDLLSVAKQLFQIKS